MKRAISIICAILCMCSVFAGISVSAEPSLPRSYTFSVGQSLSDEPISFSVKVPVSGKYSLAFTYHSNGDSISANACSIALNGGEATEVQLPRFWTTNEDYRIDGQGNQFAPEQILCQDDFTYTVMNTQNYALTQRWFSLKAGSNEIVLTPIDCDVELATVTVTAYSAMAGYINTTDLNSKNAYRGKPITVQGEKAFLKSDYRLMAASDSSSSNITPSDPVKAKINYIGGSTWKKIGDTLYWKFNTKKAGYYAISFSYRQNYVVNGDTYRMLQVNGRVPFGEATTVAFPYTTAWKQTTFADNAGVPYAIRLDEGENVISLSATTGKYTKICQEMDQVIDGLGKLYMDITMVTGDTVDIYRDYQLFNQIPEFNDRLKKFYRQLGIIDKQLLSISGGSANSYSSSVKNMMEVVRLMYDNPYSAHRYKNTYFSDYSALSACLNDMQDMPLDIDSVTLSSPDERLEKTAGESTSDFFKGLGYGFLRFMASYTEDYNNISGSDTAKNITVWVNWGRDQAQVLNRLIQSTFTNETGIGVSVKISNATIVQGVLSGNGPDVILQQARTEPVNLAMRGVLYDLSKFGDCEEVLGRFQSGADVPYRYRDGLYALPDTQSYMVLYYRTDYFEQMGIEKAPETWEEFRTVSRILARNNLKTWLPYTQITDMSLVNTGVGNLNIFPTMLLQNGMSLYNEDQTATSLTDPKVISLFTEWTEYYTKMKLPYQLDFYNRFRIGSCPMGISTYALYNTLKDTAKEIDGKWQMAPLPGVRSADGSINNASAGAGTGCAIFFFS
ncbi:MAG: extracellular solute-binding protein [Clostridia bacterium]|nr:extracellular solute-binding protein [Clostridia bacterium]